MKKERLIELLKKFHREELCREETLELKRYARDPDYERLIAEIIDNDTINWVSGPDTASSERMLTNIKHEISVPSSEFSRTTRPVNRRAVMVAASILIALFLYAIYFTRTAHRDSPAHVVVSNPILPGEPRAELLVEDGRTIDLENLSNDTTLQMDGYRIHKNREGRLSYSVSAEHRGTPIYNTIVTPRGGEYQLELVDGTRIWVNASSRLRYPLQSTGENRKIELEGEAFFEVSPLYIDGKSVPFIVTTGTQRLEVLGTSFNINSYERDVLTTLVEGKVRLSSPRSPENYLEPHEQATFNRNSGAFSKQAVDPIYAVAWKNGNFAFEDNTIQEVMNQLSRWYDVEVEYRNDVSDVHFSGTISRFEDINSVLKLIELTGSARFKIEERRVIVMN